MFRSTDPIMYIIIISVMFTSRSNHKLRDTTRKLQGQVKELEHDNHYCIIIIIFVIHYHHYHVKEQP